MKFRVERTSIWATVFPNKKPCDGVTPELVMIKKRTIAFAKGWKTFTYKKEKAWVIEINSLEELIAFQNKIEKTSETRGLIIENDGTCTEIPYCIEIYDGYRE